LIVLLPVYGFVSGIPAGPFGALPGTVLRAQSRSVGYGIFFTWTFIGQALLPPVAGYLVDRTGLPAASMYFAMGLTLLSVLLLGVFRLSRR
jgi:MFS family permease